LTELPVVHTRLGQALNPFGAKLNAMVPFESIPIFVRSKRLKEFIILSERNEMSAAQQCGS
jgi:hypothetical protein